MELQKPPVHDNFPVYSYTLGAVLENYPFSALVEVLDSEDVVVGAQAVSFDLILAPGADRVHLKAAGTILAKVIAEYHQEGEGEGYGFWAN